MTCTLVKPINTGAPISHGQLASWGVLEHVLRSQAMDQLIQELPSPSAEERESTLQQWCSSQQLSSADQVTTWQQAHGLNTEQWQQLALRPSRWLQWCQREFQHRLSSYFLQRKSQLDQVSYSLIRVQDEDLAWELFLQIREQEATFEAVASTHSEGPERLHGGRIGPVPTTHPHPCVAELLRVSQAGQLWAPRKLEGWWVILRLEEHHGARYSDVSDQLLLELGEQHLNALVAAHLTTSCGSSAPL
jgi:parvulin-like peptidyl-prolyl isomerase